MFLCASQNEIKAREQRRIDCTYAWLYFFPLFRLLIVISSSFFPSSCSSSFSSSNKPVSNNVDHKIYEATRMTDENAYDSVCRMILQRYPTVDMHWMLSSLLFFLCLSLSLSLSSSSCANDHQAGARNIERKRAKEKKATKDIWIILRREKREREKEKNEEDISIYTIHLPF